MMKLRKPAFLTALVLALSSLAAMPVSAEAGSGAGGYKWEKTVGYQEATAAVSDADGVTTVTFENAGTGGEGSGEIAGFCAQDGTGWDWSEYTQLSFTLTNESAKPVNFMLALGTGSDWDWLQADNSATVAAGESAKLSYYFKAAEWAGGSTVSNLYLVHRINMMISSTADSESVSGTIKISDMSLGGSSSVDVEPKDGFYVDGTVLRDANQNPFVMRGTAYEYAWFTWDHDPADALKEIADYGANAVRIVLADGQKWTKITAGQVANLIEQCEKNKLVAVLEVHDATGNNDENAILAAANYFAEIASVLKGHEDTVIINIANEWMESTNDTAWQQGWINAIKIMREAGLKHCILCDAGGYGQSASTCINGGAAVLEADPEHNCFFAVHMYSVAGGSASTIKSTIDAMAVRNLCFIVGEFAQKDNWGDVDEAYIMSYCQETNTGWLSWSWYGNNDAYMDMSSANAGGTLSSDWGELVVNGANGWKETAKVCSVFEGSTIVTTPSTEPETTTTTTTTTTVITTTTTEETSASWYETSTEDTSASPAETSSTAAEGGIVWGDADNNGEFELSDCVLLAKAGASLGELSTAGVRNCDLYADGSVNGKDLTAALLLMAGTYTTEDMPLGA